MLLLIIPQGKCLQNSAPASAACPFCRSVLLFGSPTGVELLRGTQGKPEAFFVFVQGFALIPAHLPFSICCRSEREKHPADDSEGGALDMCCSEKLPGESSWHPGAPRVPNAGREPRMTRAGEEPA